MSILELWLLFMTPNMHLSFPLDFPTSLFQEYQKPTWTLHAQLTISARGSCRASGVSMVLPGLPPPHQRPHSPGSMSALSLLPLFSRPPPLPRSDLHTCMLCSVMSDSVTPWTVAPRLLCLWNSPGKNTGVGCHFLLHTWLGATSAASQLTFWSSSETLCYLSMQHAMKS